MPGNKAGHDTTGWLKSGRHFVSVFSEDDCGNCSKSALDRCGQRISERVVDLRSVPSAPSPRSCPPQAWDSRSGGNSCAFPLPLGQRRSGQPATTPGAWAIDLCQSLAEPHSSHSHASYFLAQLLEVLSNFQAAT